eukprot:scaffold2734_cov350-Prasinococcus_capsulatus_cf.AAC.2
MAAAALSMRAALSSVVASTNASRSSFAGSRIVNAKATNGAKVSMVGAKGSWLPGSTAPAYLDGSLPGDVGFDPLGLGEDPESLAWCVSWVRHSRACDCRRVHVCECRGRCPGQPRAHAVVRSMLWGLRRAGGGAAAPYS